MGVDEIFLPAEVIQAQFFSMAESGEYEFRTMMGCVVVVYPYLAAMTPVNFILYLQDLALGDDFDTICERYPDAEAAYWSRQEGWRL